MTDSKKIIRIIGFDGDTDKYNMCKRIFLAQARVNGYHKIFGTLSENESQNYLSSCNDQGFGGLILAMEDTVSFNLVDTRILRAYPEGDAKLALHNLRKKYKPKDDMTLIRLKRKFAESKIEEAEEDPDVRITDLMQKNVRLK